MSLDHLCEEGLAEFEEIEVPFSIISSFCSSNHIICDTIQWTFLHFRLLARIFLRTYGIWTTVQDAIFYWYFILHGLQWYRTTEDIYELKIGLFSNTTFV